MPTFDDQDAAILTERVAAFDAVTGPRVGDYVVFADGIQRRISYIWGDGQETSSVQTSDGGSYYLGNGYVSMSGSLYSGVKPETLTDTGETKHGGVWFFHHDYATAHNGVETTMPFRVFACSERAMSD